MRIDLIAVRRPFGSKYAVFQYSLLAKTPALFDNSHAGVCWPTVRAISVAQAFIFRTFCFGCLLENWQIAFVSLNNVVDLFVACTQWQNLQRIDRVLSWI